MYGTRVQQFRLKNLFLAMPCSVGLKQSLPLLFFSSSRLSQSHNSAGFQGGHVGFGMEAGCSEHGVLHPPGVAERNELTAVSPSHVGPSHLGLCLFATWPQAVPGSLLLSSAVRCDSTESLRNSLDHLRSVLNDTTSFKLIYRYAFDFARVSPGDPVLHVMLCFTLSISN